MRLEMEPSLDPADYTWAHDVRVRFAETDAMGIVHHSRYLPYLELARAIEQASASDIREHAATLMLSAAEVNRALLRALQAARQLA